LLALTHWLAITNFFPVNGISEVVDLSRHDWNNLVCEGAQETHLQENWYQVEIYRKDIELFINRTERSCMWMFLTVYTLTHINLHTGSIIHLCFENS